MKIEVQNLRAYVPRMPADLIERAVQTDRPPMDYPVDTEIDVWAERLFLNDWPSHVFVPGAYDSVQVVITGYEGIRLRYRNTKRRARQVKTGTVLAAKKTSEGAKKSYHWTQQQRERIARMKLAYRMVVPAEPYKSLSDVEPSDEPKVETRSLYEDDLLLKRFLPRTPPNAD